ncbi:MAG TPA: C25 family cysteine peptidase, partial [Dongiaceae bacterium]|nr:C25 family cysteine peptidase [Dongiaceae bacterium]
WMALAFLMLAAPAAASEIIHEFRYTPDRFTLAAENGYTRVSVEGALPEWRAGHPDLPRLEERIEIPVDMRVTAVEVAAVEFEPFADAVTVAPALETSHDLGPEHRTAPDPGLYARTAPQPDAPIRLGYQGYQRGHHYAWVEVTPVRWTAAGGRLERVSRVTVRLVLEPTAERPVVHRRLATVGGPPLARPTRGVRGAATGRLSGPFRPTQIPSLLGSPVAYVIVTSDSLAAAFQPLADWKTQSGVPAVVRTIGFIRAQYPTAADDPERIRMFIRDAYELWGAEWVLLGGDVEIIPPRVVRMTLAEDGKCTSDLYYSCLDGNWNADGDSAYADAYNGPSDPGDDADLLPEVWVGRAPVSSTPEAQRFVQKTLTYEQTPVSDYTTSVLFFAQVISPAPWTPGHPIQLDGASLVEQDLLPILDTTPWMHVARLYQNDTAPQYRPGALHESRAVVLDSLERGYNVAVHIGHGYREVMSCGDDNLTNNDMMGLANGNRLMNFYAIDCTSNAIDFASIGEALLKSPSGGAVSNIGSTTLDYPSIGRIYQKEYFNLVFAESVTAVGEAQGRQKLPFVGDSYYDGFDRLSQLSLLLLGDPELHIYTASPRELAVTAPTTFTAGDSEVTVHVETGGAPLAGAQVTVWMPSSDYRSGVTDGSGNVLLDFHPDTLGAATVTVTAFNARPWTGGLAVVAGGDAALQAVPPLIVDDAASGRDGNGDGVADAGETLDLQVAIRNAGGTAATGVTGTLATTDAWVQVSAPAANYGEIDPGATVASDSDYRLTIPSATPDQHEAAFTLDVLGEGGLHQRQRFQLVIHAPELVQVMHTEFEEVGNGNGQPEPGETIRETFRVRNIGTAPAYGLTGSLGDADGLATVPDSLFTLPDLAPGAEGVSTPLRFVPSDPGARLSLRVDDARQTRLVQDMDIGYPSGVTALSATGAAAAVKLAWAPGAAADLAGYHVYRSTGVSGPFTRITPWAPGRSSNLTDSGLPPLATFYYQVTAIDSSGNESPPSAVIAAVTGPAYHPGFPARTNESTDTPVAVDHLSPGTLRDLVVGGQLLHVFHADGSAPVDADGL